MQCNEFCVSLVLHSTSQTEFVIRPQRTATGVGMIWANNLWMKCTRCRMVLTSSLPTLVDVVVGYRDREERTEVTDCSTATS